MPEIINDARDESTCKKCGHAASRHIINPEFILKCSNLDENGKTCSCTTKFH